MKQKLCLVFAALLCVVFVNAQNKYSLKGGLGLASGNGSYGGLAINGETAVRPTVGVIVDFPVKDKFNWQTGFLINGYGGKFVQSTETKSTSNASVYAISFPIFAKYALSDKINVYGGPQISFSLYAKADETGTDYYGKSISKTSDINSNVQKPIIFGVLGGDYSMTESLKLFAEYHLAMNNVVTGVEGANGKLNLFSVGVIFDAPKR